MLLTVLSNPIVQIAVFVFGSLILARILRRNRDERRAAEKAEARSAARRARPAFRDFRWGEAPRAEMALYHDGADERLFTRPGESLQIGEAPLTSIFYSYYLDRLQAVMIEMPHRSTKAVLTNLSERWGEPIRPDPQVHKFIWSEVPGEMQLTQAVLEDSPLKHYASLVISSRALAGEKRARGRKTPLGALSGAKAQEERSGVLPRPGRRAPMGALSGAKAREESP